MKAIYADPITRDLDLVAQRDRARATAAALEQQLADIAELHESWGNTDVDDLDLLALWEDFRAVLHPEEKA